MAERVAGPAACLLGGVLALGTFGATADAADPGKRVDPRAQPPAPAATVPATTAAADLDLLEFLGSDDVEPELQQYLANRAPARDGSGKR